MKRKEVNVRSKCEGRGVGRTMDPWGTFYTAVAGVRFVESSLVRGAGGRCSQAVAHDSILDFILRVEEVQRGHPA